MNLEKEQNFEKRENLNISTETITSDELLNIIYQNESLPQDERFLDSKKGGVFKYFRVSELSENKENKYYSIIKINDIVVGLCELEKNPYRENIYWIKFLSIDPEYQGMGYASKLTEEVFKFAKKNCFGLESSSYSTDGEEKLKPLFQKLSKETEVDFIDTDKKLYNKSK
ncbi:MAG: GNAT family N-acetyltransferase [Patescibacteria group bacterium]|nr:GNAT family N-acetyltransferase [Patescibacteria group bacterium]MDD4304403.1 GNAT family N-acetyltransferase [Patescibacteria group bacterium]MDD4695426.1 GNAT family N-acetyltransferase [Patescibacteria group bacterium]